MGWSIGWDENNQRDVGYGVPAICDHPDCNAEIDRGLSYICGGDIFGGTHGCGLFFCGKHLWLTSSHGQLCERCAKSLENEDDDIDPFPAKPDTDEWINHKASHPSWAAWRTEFLAEGMPAYLNFEEKIEWLRVKNAISKAETAKQKLIRADWIQLITITVLWVVATWKIGLIGLVGGAILFATAAFASIKLHKSFTDEDY